MDMMYDWRITEPGKSLTMHFANLQGGYAVFDATLTLKRREITGANLSRALARHPAMTIQVISGIYWQALRLKMRRCPFHPHPVESEVEKGPTEP